MLLIMYFILFMPMYLCNVLKGKKLLFKIGVLKIKLLNET